MKTSRRTRQITEYILMILLTISTLYFLYFTFIPQYEIRDHEGYLGGAIVLAGYIALVIISNWIKKKILIYRENGRESL